MEAPQQSTAPSIYKQLDDNPLQSPLAQNKPKGKFLKLFLISLLIVAIAFLGTGAVLVAAAYSPDKLPFVPSVVRVNLNRFLLELPVPRNTEQIFIGTLLNETELKQYQQKIFAEISTQGVPSNSPLSSTIALRADGPIDITNKENIKLDQTIVLLMQLMDTSYKLQGRVIVSDNVAYINISDIPQELQSFIAEYIDPSEILNKWLSIDISNLKKDTSQLIPPQQGSPTSDSQEYSLDNLVKNIFSYSMQSNYYSYLTNLGIEKVNDINTYHIQLSKSGNELKPFVAGLIDYLIENDTPNKNKLKDSKENMLKLLDYLDRITLDAYIDTNDYYVVRTNLEVLVTPPLDMVPTVKDFSSTYGVNISSNLKLDIKTGWEASNINVPQSIAVPKDAIPFDPIKSFSPQARMTKEDQQMKQDLANIGKAIGEYHKKYNQYPQQLTDLTKEGLTEIIQNSNGLPYEYYTKEDNAFLIGYLVAPDDYTKPVWQYDVRAQKGTAISYEQYLDLQGSTQIQPTKAQDNDNGDVNGMFDIKLNLEDIVKDLVLPF